MAPVVSDLGKAGKYGVKALKAFDKGGDIAKTFNVVRRPISKKGSKTFRIVANGIERVDDALGAGAKGSTAVGKGSLSIKGYSNFADGMTPEDATRYIVNNEKTFFNEFSERASSAGLDNTQIKEAFSAMRTGDYTNMATYFDTSSPVYGAVFWSGNKEGAAAYANRIGGTIMEQTPGGKVFDNWRGLQGMYPEWNTTTDLAQKPIWDALSSQYAKGAAGNATYAMKEGYANPNSVWKTIEYPILEDLMDEGIVTDISVIIIKE